MSRKIIDAVVESNKFSNYDVYTNLQSNPMYLGEVAKRFKPISLDDPFKKATPVHLVDILMSATEFPQEGEEFKFIGDKEYSLSKSDFKKVKALTIAQINPIEDVSKGIADALLWFNGSYQEPDGSILYKQVFKTSLQKLQEITGVENVGTKKENIFASAINKMHG